MEFIEFGLISMKFKIISIKFIKQLYSDDKTQQEVTWMITSFRIISTYNQTRIKSSVHILNQENMNSKLQILRIME